MAVSPRPFVLAQSAHAPDPSYRHGQDPLGAQSSLAEGSLLRGPCPSWEAEDLLGAPSPALEACLEEEDPTFLGPSTPDHLAAPPFWGALRIQGSLGLEGLDQDGVPRRSIGDRVGECLLASILFPYQA